MRSLSPKSPDFWVLIASLLAVAGLVASAAGWITQASWLRIAGLVLLGPIIVGGVGLILIVIPVLITANRRKKGNPAGGREGREGRIP